MKIIILIIFLLVLFCQNTQECKSGTILIKSLANVNKKELPTELSFSPSDIMRMILGYWVNSNNDTIIHIFIDDSSTITWNVEVEGSKCGPTFANLHFIVNSYPNIYPISNGQATFFNTLIEGDIEIIISDKPYRMKFYSSGNLSSCFLISCIDMPAYDVFQGDSLKLLNNEIE